MQPQPAINTAVMAVNRAVARFNRFLSWTFGTLVMLALCQTLRIYSTQSFSDTEVQAPDCYGFAERSNGKALTQKQPFWTDYKQFVANEQSQFVNSKDIPAEEEWLTAHLKISLGQSKIPKNIFKVNVLDHGYLHPVFASNASDLNVSLPADNAKYSLQMAHQSWYQSNPGYNIFYFDLNGCRKYLKQHFHPVFLRAFDCLEAYASKVDLFRCLVVYREGGWYSDWKEVCLVDNLLDDLSKGNTTWFSAYTPFSYNSHLPKGTVCHANAFFGAAPMHPVLSNVISKILLHIQAKFYGNHALQPTGPCALGTAIMEEGYGTDMVNTSRVGLYLWDSNLTKNGFQYRGKSIVQHKCLNCGLYSNYVHGNDYYGIHESRHFYCSDAPNLLEEKA